MTALRALGVAAGTIAAPFAVAYAILWVLTISEPRGTADGIGLIGLVAAGVGTLLAWPAMRRAATLSQVFRRALGCAVVGLAAAVCAVALADGSFAEFAVFFVPYALVAFCALGGPLWIGAGAAIAGRAAGIEPVRPLRAHALASGAAGAGGIAIGPLVAWIPGPAEAACFADGSWAAPTEPETWSWFPLGWGCFGGEGWAPTVLFACGIGALALAAGLLVTSRAPRPEPRERFLFE
ncbi:hypothetical protein [Microbacterium indicum]|uniref:hypothetical protein n=1 Tax=Microbacterium indicum TaxID=358100 RepID=UPI0004074B49|nr:hypothetical protein [Microbacterium indicum]